MTQFTLHNLASFLFALMLVMGGAVTTAQEPLVLSAPHAEASPPSPETQPMTPADCYRLALKRSETIAIQRELIRQTESRLTQALSGVLPRASFEASEKRQDGSGGSSFTLKEVPERKFTFTQPLFSGFKEFAAMAGARAERRERGFEQARAEQLLFVDVSDAFYLVLERREDMDALETIRTALLQRIDELKERERLGRSRTSEVASAEVLLQRVEADIESARSDEITARQLLEFLTGRAPLAAITDAEPVLPPIAAESDFARKAGGRPDVRAAEEAWSVSQKAVTVARAGFWPEVDVESNYYTKRVGVSSGVDWDALLTVSVPLFQGGETVGAVREAASKARQAKLEYDRAQRQAELEIRDAHANLQGALARLAALRKALGAAEENYRLQQEDYRRSLVNNLDVLQALESLEGTRRDVIHAAYEAKRRHFQLLAAAGETL